MNQKVSLFPTITAAIKSSPKDVWWIVCLDYTDVQGNLYRKESIKKGSSKVQQRRYYDWIHSSQRSAMYVPLKRGNKTAQDWDKKHAVDDAF